jgi:hypothetical protein
MRRFTVRRAYRYEPTKGAPVDTPDLLVRDGEKIVIAIECKATKLTYLAQFAEDPFEAEKKQYLQIANGVFQLWRFFSHVRRGFVKEPLDADTSAMVVTLDSFLMINPEITAKIIEEATSLADKEGELAAEDRCHIIFCPIQDLEYVLSLSTEDSLLATLKTSREQKYIGWGLREISREQAAGEVSIEPRRFPFQLDSLLPWWERSNELEGNGPSKKSRS